MFGTFNLIVNDDRPIARHRSPGNFSIIYERSRNIAFVDMIFGVYVRKENIGFSEIKEISAENKYELYETERYYVLQKNRGNFSVLATLDIPYIVHGIQVKDMAFRERILGDGSIVFDYGIKKLNMFEIHNLVKFETSELTDRKNTDCPASFQDFFITIQNPRIQFYSDQIKEVTGRDMDTIVRPMVLPLGKVPSIYNYHLVPGHVGRGPLAFFPDQILIAIIIRADRPIAEDAAVKLFLHGILVDFDFDTMYGIHQCHFRFPRRFALVDLAGLLMGIKDRQGLEYNRRHRDDLVMENNIANAEFLYVTRDADS